jgi:hypothetical protein
MIFKYLILISFTLSTASFATSNCTKSTEYEPSLCRIKLPPIATVVIEKKFAGKTSTGNIQDDDKCDKFILTPMAVKRYFRETMLFNETDFHYYKQWTPCHASGTLTFRDGRKGKWLIDALQNGTLKVENGKEIYLLCDKCNFKPW